MSASDILGSGSRDLDSARLDRENRLNPPENAPGQDSTFSDTSDIFSGSISSSPLDSGFSSLGSSPVGSFGLGSPLSGGLGSPFGGGMNGMGGAGAQTQNKSDEDKFFDAMMNGGKTIVSFFKDICKAGKDTTKRFWASYGKDLIFVGLGCTAVGFVFLLLRQKGVGIDLMVAGLLTSATGVSLLMTNITEGKLCSSMYKSDGGEMNTMDMMGSMSQEMPSMEPDFGFPQDDFPQSDFSFEEDEDAGFEEPSYEDEYEEEAFSDVAFLNSEPVAGMDKEEALASMIPITNGMVTRQYLYEMFTKVLPNLKPDYNTVKEIDEDDDIFIYWDDILRESAQATGVKEDYLDELSLTSLTENLFTITLKFGKVPGLKVDAVAAELVNIYSHSNGYNPNIYSKSMTMGLTCVVTIYTNESAMISLKDMLDNCKDFFLDNNNYMPVALGIDETGKVITKDFKKLESILITGMPRSGKSWFVQAVLTQMCALVPPSELNIYIFDPKDGISDFKSFCLPHVKKFVSGDDNIVNTLRKVVREEAPRRKKIIGDANFVNIWDFKKVNPTVKLPIIYVLIDEVVTLAERMEKETKAEFQGLLVELISQLPALGIRAFLIPHVVKNNIIAKTATDLIPCRISVCGDAEHIEASTGTKPRDFVYKLTNKGDMAVKLTDETQTLYIHGPALTSSNPENNDLFDYMRKVWTKIEPDEVANSVAGRKELESENEKLLKSLNDDSVDDMDLFNSDAVSDDSVFKDENKALYGDEDDSGLSNFNPDGVFSTDDDEEDLFNF